MMHHEVMLILAVKADADDRALLALPAQGDLRSGQVEAALAARLDLVARHPRAGTSAANRAAAALVGAADRLQAELALSGRGPLHPAAARRAAARMHAASAPAKVVAPAAIAQPGQSVHASELTEFDRLALAVLVVSGGWNARSAKRLAVIAEEFGVSVADLDRVVEGLTRFLASGEGLRGVMGDVGEQARQTWMVGPRASRIDAAEGAVERVFGRLDRILRDELHDDSGAAKARLTGVFVLFALSWVGALAWLFIEASSDDGDSAGEAATPALVAAGDALPPAAEQGGGGPTEESLDANGRPVEPVAPLAAPAKFPRPPGFTPSPMPPDTVAAAQASAAIVGDLEQLGRLLVNNRGRLDGVNLSALADALSKCAAFWPALGNRTDEVRAAIAGVARSVRGTEPTLRFVEAVPGGDQDRAMAGLPLGERIWRAAFGAGALVAIALDQTQPPEMASAVREELRRRAVALPRGEVADAFGAGAVAVLRARAPALAEALALGSADLVAASRWVDAVVVAATTDALRTDAWLAAIDACLRAPGALDKPGPSVDFLAHAVQALDFTGRGDESMRVRDALSAWTLDAAIPPSRIWVFTSLLDQDLGIAWYGPNLVLATDADAAARRVMAERIVAAFPVVERTNVGEAILVEKSALEAWRRDVDAIRAMQDDSSAARLRVAALALAAARTGHGFMLGDARRVAESNEALATLMRRELGEWMATPTGERAGLPASGVLDGEFAAEWDKLVGDRTGRVGLARGLASRPATGDLGPLDARVAASEVLRSNVPEIRAALASSLADRFANGPVLLGALVDALGEGSVARDAQDFLTRITGARIGGSNWQREARERLLERIYALSDSREHMMDLAAREIAEQAALLAGEIRAVRGAPQGAVAGGAPDVALSLLADALRDAAAKSFLAVPFPAPPAEIERTRAARRALARGTAQRMAAESPAILEHAATVVVARQPALESQVAAVLGEARRARAGAASATVQCAGDLEALLAVLSLQFAPEATERDDA